MLVWKLLAGGDWRVVVNAAACRGIAPETIESAWEEMRQAGAVVLENAVKIQNYLKSNV